MSIRIVATFLLLAPFVSFAGTARFTCPINPQDGDHCAVTVLTGSGGSNFDLPDGETIRYQVNRSDRFCVIPVLASNDIQCTYETAKQVEDYKED